jgi:hypothetical protein
MRGRKKIICSSGGVDQTFPYRSLAEFRILLPQSGISAGIFTTEEVPHAPTSIRDFCFFILYVCCARQEYNDTFCILDPANY